MRVEMLCLGGICASKLPTPGTEHERPAVPRSNRKVEGIDVDAGGRDISFGGIFPAIGERMIKTCSYTVRIHLSLFLLPEKNLRGG